MSGTKKENLGIQWGVFLSRLLWVSFGKPGFENSGEMSVRMKAKKWNKVSTILVCQLCDTVTLT